MPMPPDLHVTLLGDFCVHVGAWRVPADAWRRSRAAAIVKVLALRPDHRMRREEIEEAIWPGLPPGAANNNLHRNLHAARRALQPELTAGANPAFLRFLGDLLMLSPDGVVQVDIAAFESAVAAARGAGNPDAFRAALVHYGGDLLPHDLDEPWAVAPREALRRAYRKALADLALLHITRKEPAAAIDTFRLLVANDPVDEDAHTHLMRLYAITNQRREAERQFVELQATLRRELDADPKPATVQLATAIRGGRYPAEPSGSPASAPPVQPPAATLPSPVTSFVGRDRELAEVGRLLTRSRLVTLTGSAGCGKTRLALEAVGRLASAFPDGVWLVELAAVERDRSVPAEVAAVLGIANDDDRTLPPTIAGRIRDARALLVLDNCEHLAAGTAWLAHALLRACPHLRILATSREALRIAGETAWRVPSLPRPDPRWVARPAELTAFDAVRLFVERAAAVQPDFALEPANVRAVAELCDRLDGIPLAIELAAARLSVLSLEQIVARLNDSLGLLTQGSRVALPRHQTLRATLDWSYSLLDDRERSVFRRLAVFTGGASLEAIETVCDRADIPVDRVLDIVSGLVDKSLVVAEERDGRTRYRQLELVRQYAALGLRQAGEEDGTRARLRDWCLDLAEQAQTALADARRRTWLRRLDAEHDNLRNALRWSIERKEALTAVRLAGALGAYWLARGFLTEGSDWLARALADAANPEDDPAVLAARASAYHGAGLLAYTRGDWNLAAGHFTAARALWRRLGDGRGLATHGASLARLDHARGDYARARASYDDALAIARAVGDDRSVLRMTVGLASLAKDLADLSRAEELLAQGRALARDLADRAGEAELLRETGEIRHLRGDSASAMAILDQSVERCREIDDDWQLERALLALGAAAADAGAFERASLALREALMLARRLGDRPGAAAVLVVLAGIARQVGDRDQAARRDETALAIFRQWERKRGAAHALAGLARLAGEREDAAEAAHYGREALALAYDAQDRLGAAIALDALAQASLGGGDPAGAVELAAVVDAFRGERGIPGPPWEREQRTRLLQTARSALGEECFAATWTAGRARPFDEAILGVITAGRVISG